MEETKYYVKISHPDFGEKEKECKTCKEAVDYIEETKKEYNDISCVMQKVSARN